MKIRIVCYEDPNTWICGKIARRLAENLVALGHSCVIDWTADDTADINHHVIYVNYKGSTSGVHTLMVTHIDDALKLRRLQAGLETAKAAICASAGSVERLGSLGIARRRHIWRDAVRPFGFLLAAPALPDPAVTPYTHAVVSIAVLVRRDVILVIPAEL